MTATFSPVIASKPRSIPGFTSLQFVDLDELGVSGSPLSVLDDFRVNGLPFSPHPHAGFAAVTYVFEDSDGAARSRASSGVDLVVQPGGIAWTHAGSGIVHEEIPAEPGRELHGVQLFVNLSARNKLTDPQVLSLEPDEVPVWHSDTNGHVRVVVGRYGGVLSPLVPIEPFTLLDVTLHGELSFPAPDGHNAVIYVRTGGVVARVEGREAVLEHAHAVAVRGGNAVVSISASEPAQLLFLSGAAIDEPVVSEGPFIMNDVAQVNAAIRRYQRGEMGQLAPQ